MGARHLLDTSAQRHDYPRYAPRSENVIVSTFMRLSNFLGSLVFETASATKNGVILWGGSVFFGGKEKG
jgi:hypothetical protein